MRALLLTQRLPYAPNRGDRLRAWHQIAELRRQGWQVDVLALVHDAEEAAHAQGMRAGGLRVETALVPAWLNRVRGAASLAGTRPLTLTLLDSPALGPAVRRLLSSGPPDVVLACSSSMAALALRPPLVELPLVLDFVDVDSEKWRALARTSRWPKSWIYRREARTLRALEARAARSARISLLTTERERVALLGLASDVTAEVLPNGVDLDRFHRPDDAPAPEPRVVFTGVMNYAPNADAAVWLAREIWPLVLERRPDASLDIVGATPHREVRALHDEASRISVTGSVPDVRPYLWRAHVAVAPIRVARGVQNKVLEAAAAGLPCVVTPAVSAGLPDLLRAKCPVADSTRDVADLLVEALDSVPDHQGWAAAVEALSWTKALARLSRILEQAATGD